MAEEQPNPQPQQAEEREVVVEQQEEPRRAPKLRYLDFVQVAAAQATVCLAALYGLAKDHAGPLRPGVDAVESAVKGVVGPVCGLPLDVLAFVDRKVDDTVHEVGKHLPSALKAASAWAYAVARELAAEAQQSGVKAAARAALAKAEPMARDLYARYEPAAEHLAVSAWRSLNGLPVFPHVAQIVVPTVAHWAEKYNRAVATAADHGYARAKYLPTIPIERIAKVFSSPTEAESQ